MGALDDAWRDMQKGVAAKIEEQLAERVAEECVARGASNADEASIDINGESQGFDLNVERIRARANEILRG